MRKLYPGFETYEEDEADREDAIVLAKARGKGAPKKKKTKEGELLILILCCCGSGGVVIGKSVLANFVKL